MTAEIKLKAGDNVVIKAQKEILLKCNLFGNMFNDLDISTDEEIPVPNVEGAILNLSNVD